LRLVLLFLLTGGHLELLKWIRSRTTPSWTLESTDYRAIASSGRKDIVLWLKETYPRRFEEPTFVFHALHSGHVELLRWLATFVDVNWIDRSITRYAVRSGSVMMVEFVVSKGAPIKNYHDLIEIAASTNLAMMKLLREKYQLENRSVLIPVIAAKERKLSVLKYLHGNSQQMPNDLGLKAFQPPVDLDLLLWCKEINCANFPLSTDVCIHIATATSRSAERLRMLKYLISCGAVDRIGKSLQISSLHSCDMPVEMWKLLIELFPKPPPVVFEHAVFSPAHYALETVQYIFEEYGHRFVTSVTVEQLKLIRKDVAEYLFANQSLQIHESSASLPFS
jgi:hypothetical protein